MLVNTTNIPNHLHHINNIMVYYCWLVRYNQFGQQQQSLSSLPSPPTPNPTTTWYEAPLTHDVNGKNEEEEDE